MLKINTNPENQITIPLHTETSKKNDSLSTEKNNTKIAKKATFKKFIANSPSSQNENRKIPRKVKYGRVTLRNLTITNKDGTKFSNIYYAKPGEELTINVDYFYDNKNFSSPSVPINQIIVGYNKIGAKECIYSGTRSEIGHAKFKIKAPDKKGPDFSMKNT